MDPLHITPSERNLGQLVREAMADGVREFRPCAFFDEPLDCIRVIARDCSVTETRVNGLLTVLEANYSPESGPDKYVGFTIKGAKYFCQQHGVDLTAPVKLTELLDKILATSSEPAVRFAIDCIARPLVESKRIEDVRLSAAA